jgi:hypothetical protein
MKMNLSVKDIDGDIIIIYPSCLDPRKEIVLPISKLPTRNSLFMKNCCSNAKGFR